MVKLNQTHGCSNHDEAYEQPWSSMWYLLELGWIECNRENLTTHVQHVLKGCCLKNNLARQKLGIIEVNEVGRGSLSLSGSVKMRASKALAETQRLGASTERQ